MKKSNYIFANQRMLNRKNLSVKIMVIALSVTAALSAGGMFVSSSAGVPRANPKSLSVGVQKKKAKYFEHIKQIQSELKNAEKTDIEVKYTPEKQKLRLQKNDSGTKKKKARESA